MYSSIHSKHFVYFLKEAEYRRKIKYMNPMEKIFDFAIVLSTVGIDEYLNKEDLIKFDYDLSYDD